MNNMIEDDEPEDEIETDGETPTSEEIESEEELDLSDIESAIDEV
jgi:hypothetical protein